MSAATEPLRGGSAHSPYRGWTRIADGLFRVVATVFGLGILALLTAFVVVIVEGGKAALGSYGLGFLTGITWDPIRNIYGVLPFAYGTVLTSAIALLIAVPLSLGIAIFLSEQAPNWSRGPFAFAIELLAAVPSVVYGLWGFAVLVPLMRSTIEPRLASIGGPLFSGPVTGLDVLSASVILAVMIIPTISAISREALNAVPQSQREAALSLGATRWEATRISVLTYARTGLFGAIVLGLGRALGETMAVTMTIGNRNAIPTSLFSQGQTIASLIATQFTEATGPLELSALIEAGLVLLVITILINVFARLMVWRVVRTTGEGTVE